MPQTAPPSPAPSSSRSVQRVRLPWGLTLLLVASGVIPGVILAKLGDPSWVPALVAGIVMGLLGTMIGSALRTTLGGALLLGILALHMAYPTLDPRLAGLVFALAAGWETARTGGRAMPLSLACAVLIWILPKTGLDEAKIAGLFAAGLGGGLLLAYAAGLQRFPKLPPEGDLAGLRQTVLLGVGLWLSITFARHLPSAHAVWVVDMFVVRAMTASHLTIPKAFRFGLGTLLGGGLALAIEHSGYLTPQVAQIIAAISLVLGLRLLPLGPPWPATCLTITVLFALAPTPSEALFRAEAALLAAGLAIVLGFLLDCLVRLISSRPAP